MSNLEKSFKPKKNLLKAFYLRTALKWQQVPSKTKQANTVSKCTKKFRFCGVKSAVIHIIRFAIDLIFDISFFSWQSSTSFVDCRGFHEFKKYANFKVCTFTNLKNLKILCVF